MATVEIDREKLVDYMHRLFRPVSWDGIEIPGGTEYGPRASEILAQRRADDFLREFRSPDKSPGSTP